MLSEIRAHFTENDSILDIACNYIFINILKLFLKEQFLC